MLENLLLTTEICSLHLKGSIKKVIGERVKMDSELKEVKEKLCTLTAPLVESKDKGQLNYTVKLIVLIVASS